MSQATRALVTLISAAAVSLTPAVAYAGGVSGGGTGNKNNGTPPAVPKTSGGSKDGVIFAGVQFDTSHNGTGPAAGPLTPVSNWTPPACWYAPKWDAEGAARDFLGYDRSPNHSGMDVVKSIRDHYENGHPYTNFNIAKQGKGYWWAAYQNPDELTDPGVDDCTNPPFWVDKGTPPPPIHNTITPQLLAQLAYAHIRIPQGQARINPTGTQTVKVPTWVWMDKTHFHPVSVRASIPVLGIQATTTATPIALHLDPGTPDATTHPTSGDCPIDTHGNLGTPYVKGDSGDPPCGVTYQRSTQASGPYTLKATITWRISWTGTDHTTPTPLPNGTYGTPQPIHVQEIQTIN